MSKKLVYFVLALGLFSSVSVASAETVAYWRFDDVGNADVEQWGPVAAGNPLPDSDQQTVWRKAAHDHSGNGNHLTTWEWEWAGFNWSDDVPAAQVPLTGIGNNLSMASTGGCCPASMTWSEQSLPSGTDIEGITPAEFTIEGSFKLDSIGWAHTIVGRDGMNAVSGNAALAPLYFQVLGGMATVQFADVSGYFHIAQANFELETNRWYNMVAVSDGSALSLYLDNELVDQTDMTLSGSSDTSLAIGSGSGFDWEAGTWTVGRGLYDGGHGDRVFGYIDEVRISDTALTKAEFLFVTVKASNPYPADDISISNTEVQLLWDAGIFAAEHDVYFSDNRDNVNDADSDDPSGPDEVYKGRQSETTYPPMPFSTIPVTPRTTYYWRIDEVNDAHPDKLWRGNIWSFTVLPLEAYDPSPVHEATYVNLTTNLSWNAGSGAVVGHIVYFGQDYDDVNNIPVGTTTGPEVLDIIGVPNPTTTPAPTLVKDNKYYWRVDEVEEFPASIYKGDVWEFTTIPDIPITDVNLVGWWKLDDEGSGTTAVDHSGHDYHGTIFGTPDFVSGQDGDALELDGIADYVELPIGSLISSLTNSTFMTWVDFSNAGGAWQRIFDFGSNTTIYMFLTPRIGLDGEMRFAITIEGEGAPEQIATAPDTLPSGWHNVAVTINAHNDTIGLYLDGSPVAENTAATLTPSALGNTANNWLGRSQYSADAYFNGSLDDFRIYDYALSQAEIIRIISPPEAWRPKPADGATIDERKPALEWLPGIDAYTHEVYFSTSFDDVNGRSGDALVYVGTDPCFPYPLTEPPLDLDTEYFWLVDEVSLTDERWDAKGVWSFMTAECLALDNMEDHNDRGEMRDVWTDGFANTIWQQETWELIQGGNSGSNLRISTEVGSPSGATGPIHDGYEAMALYYDNDNSTYPPVPGDEHFVYDTGGNYWSEIEANTTGPNSLDFGEDWAGEGVKSLSLYFTGHPKSSGSYVYDPNSAWTIHGYGRDIEMTHDEFYGVFLELTGDGTVQALVASVQNTHPSAKAGVMIRNKLTPYSSHAFVCVTPGSGVSFQRRVADGGVTIQDQITGTAPHWVKLMRSGNWLYASHANDVGGSPDYWSSVGDEQIIMDPNVYIGFAVTSHTEQEICRARFEETSASYTEPAKYHIGPIGTNDPEKLWVALEDGDGTVAIVEHNDVNALTYTTWQPWYIRLTDFNDLDFNSVRKVYVGVGDRGNTTTPGGSGCVYVDDIRTCPPVCVPELPELIRPYADIYDDPITGYDCTVDEKDIRVLVNDWLLSDEVITTVPPIAANLIARYEFENNFDDTGPYHSYHASAPSGSDPGFAAGVIGSYALSLDGVDDHLVVEPNVGINVNVPRTISCWAKANSTTIPDWTNIFGFSSNTAPLGNKSFDIQIVGETETTTAGYFGLHVHGWQENIMPLDQDWHHFAGTYDGTTIRWYGDGARVGSVVREINTEDNVHVGKRADMANTFPGMVDDARIYNYALLDAEVAYLAADGAATLHVPIPSDADLYRDEPPGQQWVNFRDYSYIADGWLDKRLWP